MVLNNYCLFVLFSVKKAGSEQSLLIWIALGSGSLVLLGICITTTIFCKAICRPGFAQRLSSKLRNYNASCAKQDADALSEGVVDQPSASDSERTASPAKTKRHSPPLNQSPMRACNSDETVPHHQDISVAKLSLHVKECDVEDM
jgi:hypothetical protein